MGDPEYVCEDCAEPLASDSVVTCRHCGAKPSAGHWKWAKIDTLLAVICFVTVIGSPLGFYYVLRTLSHRKKRNASPAIPA